MLTVVWNPRWFHLIEVLAKGGKLNAVSCAIEMLSPSSKLHSTGAQGDKRKPIIPVDHAYSHTAQLSAQVSEQNRMKTVPHPP
jgi:hypothetical protein